MLTDWRSYNKDSSYKLVLGTMDVRENYVAFISTTARVRVPEDVMKTAVEIENLPTEKRLFEVYLDHELYTVQEGLGGFWIWGPSGPDDTYKPGLEWCDKMLELLGY